MHRSNKKALTSGNLVIRDSHQEKSATLAPVDQLSSAERRCLACQIDATAELAQRVVGSFQPRLLSLYIPSKETEALEAELKTILAKI
jgi:hypothetical protein